MSSDQMVLLLNSRHAIENQNRNNAKGDIVVLVKRIDEEGRLEAMEVQEYMVRS